MIKILAINGVYELECDSNGTYHEIVAKLVGTFVAQTTYLPLDPISWTAQQKIDAGLFIHTYGEAVAAGASYEPNVAKTGPLYSYVAANTAKAHVKVG